MNKPSTRDHHSGVSRPAEHPGGEPPLEKKQSNPAASRSSAGNGADDQPRGHPIGVVARRTAIPPDLLRAWEKRYSAVEPARTRTGRRLYSDDDIERLRHMRTLVEGRRRISDVARLSLLELIALVKEDEREAVVPARPRPRPAVGTLAQLLTEALEAVAVLDRERLERALQDAALAFSPTQVRRELLVPLMATVGDRWHDGRLRIMNEHLASVVVRSFLANISLRTAAADAPVAVATTPAGQRHEIGALLATAVAVEAGWNVLYLGPDLPAEEIAAAALQGGARAVLLSVAYQSAEPHLPLQLRQLRRYLGTGFPVFVGGRAAPVIREILDEIDAVCLDDVADLQSWLGHLSD